MESYSNVFLWPIYFPESRMSSRFIHVVTCGTRPSFLRPIFHRMTTPHYVYLSVQQWTLGLSHRSALVNNAAVHSGVYKYLCTHLSAPNTESPQPSGRTDYNSINSIHGAPLTSPGAHKGPHLTPHKHLCSGISRAQHSNGSQHRGH